MQRLNKNTENKSIEFFTEKLLEITEKNIPKSSPQNLEKTNHGLTKNVQMQSKIKKHMLRIAKKNPTCEA